AYPVPASAPNPVRASFTRWLATPAGRMAAARYGSGSRNQATPATPAAPAAPARAVRLRSISMQEIVITAAAAACPFVAAPGFLLRMSSRRRRRATMAAPAHPRRPGPWEERPWSFGPEEGEDYGGTPGYGRPPGYGPPPLWTEAPHDRR